MSDCSNCNDCSGDCASCGDECGGGLQAAVDQQRFLDSINDNFKVAIAIKDTMVAPLASMESTYKLYEFDEGKRNIIKEDILFPMENSLAVNTLEDYFRKMRINVLITGGISPGTAKLLEGENVHVIKGARGSESFVLKQYLAGKLN